MEGSINDVVHAIEGLYSNPIKDYIFPIASALFSALLGGWAAFHTTNKLENNRIQMLNIDALNEVILSASSARDNLTAIKGNYYNYIGTDPFQRILAIPPVVIDAEPLKFNILSLAFLAPSDLDVIDNRWQRIDYISTLFKNYNNVLAMWRERNNLMHQIMPHTMHLHGQEVSQDQLEKILGLGQLALLSDLTEQLLISTDDLLIEFSCFLMGFPVVTREVIPSRFRKHRKLLTVFLPNDDEAFNRLSLVPELDFESASRIHSIDINELKHRYRRIYLQ